MSDSEKQKYNEEYLKKYKKLVEQLQTTGQPTANDTVEIRKEHKRKILSIIKDFKGSSKFRKYIIDPLVYYGSSIVNQLECFVKENYNKLTKEGDPTVTTTITIWPTDDPNSKNKMISNMDVTMKSKNFPYSSMDSVEGYIKQLVNHIKYVEYDSLPEIEKQQKRNEGEDVKLLKPIRKKITMFPVEQGEPEKETKETIGGKTKSIRKNRKKNKKHSKKNTRKKKSKK